MPKFAFLVVLIPHMITRTRFLHWSSMFALKVTRGVTWVSKLVRFMTLWKEKKLSQIQSVSDFVSENIIVHIMSSFSFSL